MIQTRRKVLYSYKKNVLFHFLHSYAYELLKYQQQSKYYASNPRGEYSLIWDIQVCMCSPKWYGFSPALIRNRVSTLAILIFNRVWVLYSSLEWSTCMLFRSSSFFMIIDNTINKCPPKLCLGQLCQPQRPKVGYRIFGLVIIRVEKSADFVINWIRLFRSGPQVYPKFFCFPRGERFEPS